MSGQVPGAPRVGRGPTPTFTVSMRHVGNDGPFSVVRVTETIHNIGTVRVHFVGRSLTVLGMNA